jgi:hypothetical protein
MKPPEDMRRPFLAASANHASLVIVIIVMTSLAEQEPLSNDPTALARGTQ